MMETVLVAFGADVKERDRAKQRLIPVHTGYFNSFHLPMTDQSIFSDLFLRLSVRPTKPVVPGIRCRRR